MTSTFLSRERISVLAHLLWQARFEGGDRVGKRLIEQ